MKLHTLLLCYIMLCEPILALYTSVEIPIIVVKTLDQYL